MTQTLNFTAIDFETANYRSHSACQLGIATVRGGEIIFQESWLIKPPDQYFSFSHIHGITCHHVADAPDFGELWHHVKSHIDGQLIAAHNASFDLGVLLALFKHYRLGSAEIAIVDSLAVARKAWPWLNNFKLPTVASHVGQSLNHHDAGSDARACAAIICAAEREQPGMMARMVRRCSAG